MRRNDDLIEMMGRNKNRYSGKSGTLPHKALLLFLLLSVALFLMLLRFNGQAPIEARDEPVSQDAPCPVQLTAGPFQREAEQRARSRQLVERVQKGDTLGHVLDRLGLDRGQAYSITSAAKGLLDLTQVRPGDQIVLWVDRRTGQPERFEFCRTQSERLILIRTPAGYAGAWQKYDPLIVKGAAEGRIEGSLWGTAVERHGLDPELVLGFADIFAYDVDFFTDVQNGDQFALLFEKEYCRGSYVKPGRILAARFVNGGRTLEAFHHRNAKGEDGYYDAEGRSLKKMFLKSPLQYRRISSFFSRSRFHPILKIFRPHLGVDYAAPTGTPVSALGAGRIDFIGWKGGYGKFIIIEHGKSFTTHYGHLSGFAKGLKKGSRVSQSQLIGYVGSTGLATGPHLDFRVKKGKEFIDPLSLKSEPAPPIEGTEKVEFEKEVQEARAMMTRLVAARR